MNTPLPSAVALIPARAGSKRTPGKNIAPLAGHPVLAYTICAARLSGLFQAVVVSTDSPDYAAVARHYGAEAPFLRPAALAGDLSPDIDWIRHALASLDEQGRRFELFSILRPTSPFRQPETIRRAFEAFLAVPGAHSLRAVEKCGQHPGKMWVRRGQVMLPLLPLQTASGTPWHSSPYQALPEVYIQNASLEIARVRVALDSGSIAGEIVVPFLTQGYEGWDINQPGDLTLARERLAAGEAVLPPVDCPAYAAPARPEAS
jgi:N-acylneuraminate cytidylyltransferase